MSSIDLEAVACTPIPLDPAQFNPSADLPHGLTLAHLESAMQEFLAFLGFLNGQLRTRQLTRLEAMLMPANFSSVVGEFMTSGSRSAIWCMRSRGRRGWICRRR